MLMYLTLQDMISVFMLLIAFAECIYLFLTGRKRPNEKEDDAPSENSTDHGDHGRSDAHRKDRRSYRNHKKRR